MLTIPYTGLAPAGFSPPQLPVLQAASPRSSLAAQNAGEALRQIGGQQQSQMRSILDAYANPAPPSPPAQFQLALPAATTPVPGPAGTTTQFQTPGMNLSLGPYALPTNPWSIFGGG